jgi:uncharacterized protein HemY
MCELGALVAGSVLALGVWVMVFPVLRSILDFLQMIYQQFVDNKGKH